jgi:hypothetical protein
VDAVVARGVLRAPVALDGEAVVAIAFRPA